MSRYTYIAVIAALALMTPTVYSAAATTGSALTSTAFAAAPGTVFDNTPTTGADATAWGTAYTQAWFGPGTVNTTAYVYAMDITSAGVFTKITSRTLNTTALSNSTAATATDAKVSDATATVTSTTAASYKAAVGGGYFALAYVVDVTTAGVTGHQNIKLLISQGGASSVLVNSAIVSTAAVACAATGTAVGVSYQYTVNSIWYDNSTFYVAYTTSSTEFAVDAGCPTTPPTGTAKLYIKQSVQGFAVDSSATAKWTTAVDVATTAAGRTYSPNFACGPTNLTNATTIYCTTKSDLQYTGVTSLYPITVSSGTLGSAATIATDVDATTGTTYRTTYTVAGFVYSIYQPGVLLNAYNITPTSTPTSTTNTLSLYNATTGATNTNAAITGYSTATTFGQYAGAGLTYGLGYAILDYYQSAAAVTTGTSRSPSAYTLEVGSYFVNGSANTSKVAIGTFYGDSNRQTTFVDVNGALWVGIANYGFDPTDGTVSGLYKGVLGKLVDQIYSSGNVLASFFALLSIMIAALFAF